MHTMWHTKLGTLNNRSNIQNTLGEAMLTVKFHNHHIQI